MNKTTQSAAPAEIFILAGRNDAGIWQAVETASIEDGETAEDVRTFLETMAHANSHSFVELEIMTAAEFALRRGGEPTIAA